MMKVHHMTVDSSKFTLNEQFTVVYTDGACSDNGKVNARAGIGVWFGPGHPLNVSKRVQGRQTNNTAEIQAVTAAIVQAKTVGINRLYIKTDSQFTINCMTQWIGNWKRNGWKTAKGGPVQNMEDLKRLDSEMLGMQISWEYVPGHSGNHGNVEADRLAVAGSQLPLY